MADQSIRRCRHIDTRNFDTFLCCFSCGMTFINSLTYLPPERDNSGKADGSSTSQQLGNSRQAGDYVYKPLDLLSHRQEIRLLVLQPGSYTDELQCEIEYAALSSIPHYEALSYTWAGDCGNSSFSGRIRCLPSGKLIRITGNCEAALRRVRKEDSKRHLWVDAIRIDQYDIKERNHQVNHMKTIFENAFRVVIYLGESTDSSDRLFEYLGKDSWLTAQ
ncbi:hypothetical protein FGG08_005227 [Glutinoglossum americanum]|uniref:Heterokaryon incompatibility domain-containing protein n=1 Tax=Glutinoglossum americanum TaxID=1670608 RepID=A0A9P8L335_9PEZI|nr:hypothetical protein FGG08_005227 [Glutinoglossum americanum]